jgi:DNA-binding transcriptional ArsR family regulator
MTTPGDEPHTSSSEGQAALFASLADVTSLAIIRYLGDGDPRTVTQITASTGAERRAVLMQVDELRHRGMLVAHHGTAFTRYAVKDIRILQLLELATEMPTWASRLSLGPVPSSDALHDELARTQAVPDSGIRKA